MNTFERWLCLNKFCSICAKEKCKKRDGNLYGYLKKEKALELWIAISLKKGEVDIALDRHKKRRFKRLLKEMKALEEKLKELVGFNYKPKRSELKRYKSKYDENGFDKGYDLGL